MNDTLELFNCAVVDSEQVGGPLCLTHVANGLITDFVPSMDHATILLSYHPPLNIKTLFTREERDTAPLEHLLVKQVLHYIEVYGLGTPGLFGLECDGGTIATMHFVKGVSFSTLGDMVRDLIYANAPIKDVEQVKRIIKHYDFDYDINLVANNELRVLLYRPGLDTFKSGDDVVRYMCYQATGDTLLIKSQEVIEAVKATRYPGPFFFRHELPLAQVFNRHKRIILAAKNTGNANEINRVSRLSKTRHVALREPMAKTFVRDALRTSIIGYASVTLERVTLRDKFKFLNLLAQKRVQSTTASFKIRNGKVFTRGDRPVYPLVDIDRVEHEVLGSLSADLAHLHGQTILLDAKVDYGLPVSRKQTVGNLPFGTRVMSHSNELVSGIYWENQWGASDLDLSTIDLDGNRVGWGGLNGYTYDNITFSGDLTDARNGAMEFMTSRNEDYCLFVNVYAGVPGSKMELVVGENADSKQWIGETLIREKHTLHSRDSVVGFVRGNTFIVWAGRLGSNRVSGTNPIVNESRADFWTLQGLLSALGVKFDVDRDAEVEYNHDLSYRSFSFDKLEAVFKNKAA